MVDSAGGNLKRSGNEAAGSVGWYIPRMQCITWSGILWFSVNIALVCFRVLTLPLYLIVHSPTLLEPLYRPVPRDPLPWPEPGTVGWYIPRCIMWAVLVPFNVNAFMHLDLWIALLGSLVHTLPLLLLLHFPNLLHHLDHPVSRQHFLQEEEVDDDKEYVIVHRP